MVRLLYLVQRQPGTKVLAVRLVVLCQQPQGLLLPLDRRNEVPSLGAGGGQGVEAVGILPVGQFAGAGGQLDGLLAVAVLLVGAGGPEPGAFVVRRDILGIEADRLVVVGDRLVVLLLGGPGEAAVVVRWDVLGVKTDRLVVVGDRLVVLLLGGPGEAAVVVRRGVLGIEVDRLVVVSDRLVVLPLGAPGEAAVVVRQTSLGSRRIASP